MRETQRPLGRPDLCAKGDSFDERVGAAPRCLENCAALSTGPNGATAHGQPSNAFSSAGSFGLTIGAADGTKLRPSAAGGEYGHPVRSATIRR